MMRGKISIDVLKRRGLSPVIGVVLLLAIVVILAGIIGTFVFGLGESVADTAPNANFDFTYDEEMNEDLTIRHAGGDIINPNRITVTGAEPCTWGEATYIRAGSTCRTNATQSRVSVVWDDGDSSAELSRYDIPANP